MFLPDKQQRDHNRQAPIQTSRFIISFKINSERTKGCADA
jgi:hypothetical protein